MKSRILIMLFILLSVGCSTQYYLNEELRQQEQLTENMPKFNKDKFRVMYTFRKNAYIMQVILGYANNGKVIYSPCQSALNFEKECAENLFITEEDLKTIYDMLVNYNVFEIEWQQKEYVELDEIRENLIIEIGENYFEIPPDLASDKIVAEDIYKKIKELIPEGTKLNIQKEMNKKIF